MFTFFFKYPWAAYQRGTLVLERGWPVWVLAALCVLGAAAFAAVLARRRRAGIPMGRTAVLWLLQTLSLLVLLVLLWQPALSVSSLSPQQNIVAVVVDDSRSMGLAEDGKRRVDQAKATLDGGLIESLKKRFQVRLYRMGSHVERIDGTARLTADASSTRIGDALKEATGEVATLPVGAIVLLSDGADNSGGIDLETTAELRRSRIPVHAIGYGREKMARDIEVLDVQLPARALVGTRLNAAVTFRQSGYAGRKARVQVSDGRTTVAAREITFKDDGNAVTETLVFPAAQHGAQTYRISIEAQPDEDNPANNALNRVVNVEDRKPRILYFEGEPRWEFKFIRRAAEDDPSIGLTSILRTTQNKIYRQGVAQPKELEQGFPSEVKDLFAFQGVVLGTVEAASLTPSQVNLLKEFVDRRGGGLLFLGGRHSFSEGQWQQSPLAELIPVTLPDRKGTFHRDPAAAELTAAGRDSLITRLDENGEKNLAKWKSLPLLADYQEVGEPKPGAAVLAEAVPTSRGRFPLLVTENYGRGRTGVFATGGSWRWRMGLDSKDHTQEIFWRQLLRWLVQDVQGPVTVTTTKSVYADETRVPLRVEVRDANYLVVPDALVSARLMGPDGLADRVELRPDPVQPGIYTAEWTAAKPGSYLAEVTAKQGETELGGDVVTFRREDGVAENFRTEQNRELLEKLASQTGGRYFRPSETNDLLEVIALSDAGLTVKETRPLWNMPAALLLFALLKSAEWLLRRRWGAV
jgi:uncharacterized membrane protein